MTTPLPTSKKIFDLEGEAQINSDGRSRQDELRICIPGEPVHLLVDRAAQGEAASINVLSARHVPIGRLTRQYCAMLAPQIESGRSHRARLHCLRGGIPGYPLYGARISIAWDDQPEHPCRPLDDAQVRFRGKASGAPTARPALPRGAEAIRPALAAADPDATRIALMLAAILILALMILLLGERLASNWCWACA